MRDKQDKTNNESAAAENADNAGVSSEDSPDTPVSLPGGENAVAQADTQSALGGAASGGADDSANSTDGGETSASFDDLGIPEIDENDIEQSIARIRSEVLALSGLDGDEKTGADQTESPEKESETKPAAKKATAKKSAEEKPTTKKTTVKKPASKKPTAKKPAAKKSVKKPEQDVEVAEVTAEADAPAKKPAAKKSTASGKKPAPKKPAAKKTTQANSTAANKAAAKTAPAGVIVFEDFGDDELETEIASTVDSSVNEYNSHTPIYPIQSLDNNEESETEETEGEPFTDNETETESGLFADNDTETEGELFAGGDDDEDETMLAPQVVDTFAQGDIYDEEGLDDEILLVRTDGVGDYSEDADDDGDIEPQVFGYEDEEEHILFDDGSWEEAATVIRPVILFEDVDDDELEEGEQPVVLFQDVDDTYLNQVDLVDRRLDTLRKGSGVSALTAGKPAEESPTSGVIQFIDEDEVPRGKNLLDYDVDTLIKQLLRRSKKRREKVIPIEDFNLGDAQSWLDYKGADPEKAQVVAEIDELLKHAASDPLLYNLFGAVSVGSNSVVHSIKSEAITLDSEWITTIEDGLFFIEDIIKNPKKFIIDNDIIMEVERARKTTSKTVRHLAQNTKNISKIDDDGFVTPKKVLTTEMDEDLAIYENRFVSTLVGRLTAFVESRKADIQSKFRIYDISQVSMNSRFKYGPSEVECNFSVAVKEPPKDNVLLDKAMYLVNKVNDISKRLRILRNSEFMRKLSALKPIIPPISKTNIIKMNVNYSTCYKLWLFIASYTMVGYSVEVKEKRLPVGGNYFDDLSALTALSMRSLFDHEIINRDAYASIESKPPKTRKFKVVPDFSMTHKAKDRLVEVQDEAINEYYFRKIQELFEEKAPIILNDDGEVEEQLTPSNVITEKRNVNINYERYCKSLIQVSNQLLTDSINSDAEKQSVIHVDALKRKKREYEKHKEMLRKFSTVAKLKASDLEKTLCEEARYELKLEKLTRELELLEARSEKRKVKRKKKAVTKKPENRKEKAVKKAAEYKQSLTEKQEEERLAEEQKKESRREERKRDKELKLLAELKYKYKDEPEDTGW